MFNLIAKLIVKTILVVSGIVGITTISYFGFKLYDAGKNNQTTNKVTIPSSPQISPTPQKQNTQINKAIQQNTINCTGPDGVVFKTTQKECDDFNTAWGNKPKTDNTDPYIKCNINANCGGGYKEMKRSTCEEMICCQSFSDSSKWTFTSKEECSRQQKNDISNSNVEWCSSMAKYNEDNPNYYFECMKNYGY